MGTNLKGSHFIYGLLFNSNLFNYTQECENSGRQGHPSNANEEKLRIQSTAIQLENRRIHQTYETRKTRSWGAGRKQRRSNAMSKTHSPTLLSLITPLMYSEGGTGWKRPLQIRAMKHSKHERAVYYPQFVPSNSGVFAMQENRSKEIENLATFPSREHHEAYQRYFRKSKEKHIYAWAWRGKPLAVMKEEGRTESNRRIPSSVEILRFLILDE